MNLSWAALSQITLKKDRFVLTNQYFTQNPNKIVSSSLYSTKMEDKEIEKENWMTISSPVNSIIDTIMEYNHRFVGRKKSVKEEINNIVQESDGTLCSPDNNCSTCGKPIETFEFWSLHKYNPPRIGNTTGSKIIEHHCFCSSKCLNEFAKKVAEDIENFELLRVDRCSSYYDCEDLDNLRGMCEKEERLDYTPGLQFSLTPKNFCDPANAGIIKASININKELKQTAKENRINFKLTTAMTILVIALTVVNLWVSIHNPAPQKIEELTTNISSALQTQTIILNSSNQKIENVKEDIKNILYTTKDNVALQKIEELTTNISFTLQTQTIILNSSNQKIENINEGMKDINKTLNKPDG